MTHLRRKGRLAISFQGLPSAFPIDELAAHWCPLHHRIFYASERSKGASDPTNIGSSASLRPSMAHNAEHLRRAQRRRMAYLPQPAGAAKLSEHASVCGKRNSHCTKRRTKLRVPLSRRSATPPHGQYSAKESRGARECERTPEPIYYGGEGS